MVSRTAEGESAGPPFNGMARVLPVAGRLTKIDPADEGVSVVTILVDDIAEAQHVKLFVSGPARDIHGKEDGPGNKAAKEADGDGNPQIAQEEVGIQRMVIEDISVRNLVEGAEPVQETLGQIGRVFPSRLTDVSLDDLRPRIYIRPSIEGPTHSVRRVPRYVRGAYCRRWLLLRIKKRTRKTTARSKAGTRVDTKLESELELFCWGSLLARRTSASLSGRRTASILAPRPSSSEV